MKSPQLRILFIIVLPLTLAGCRPSATKIAIRKLKVIDNIVDAEIKKGSFPGAVVVVGQDEKVLYRRASGNRQIRPGEEAMNVETVFDIASLTKPIATAASIMILRDREKIQLGDKVAQYIPEFACKGKEEATIEHLLTHTSGLPAYTNASALSEQFGVPCPDKVIEKICSLEAREKPGKECRYSCLGYITLAKILEIVSGQKIDRFAGENIFQKLKMQHTAYKPPESWAGNIASTQIVKGLPLGGIVHDPLAQLMDGISGNAGVFSTADDLAIYCRMLLNAGTYDSKRVLTPESVRLLTSAASHGRACGFDVESSYAWIKGDNAPERTFCHSGYTGTSIVCDPENKIYIIILTNRAHPDDKGTVRPVRTKVANLVFETLANDK